MATEKTKRWSPALIHAACYSLPFLLLRPSALAWAVMVWTHFAIDRWRLARYLVWAKNWLGPNKPWSECSRTGYADELPPWLSTWLLFIADNICHLVINGLALKYL